MTRAEVIAMARGVGIWCTLTDVACAIDALERFAALVAEAEREACAQIAADTFYGNAGELNHVIAEAIRARRAGSIPGTIGF